MDITVAQVEIGLLTSALPVIVGRTVRTIAQPDEHLDERDGCVRVGQDRNRLDPPAIPVVGVAETGEDVGEPLDARIEQGYDRERRRG